MGSIMSAISDDIDDYVHLCRKYGEPVQYSHGSADCYGDHCRELRNRRDAELRAKIVGSQRQDTVPFIPS